MSQELINALQNPSLYDHEVKDFQVLETHISWVILTGPYAYKIKKPMDFGFLNFTTLDKREHFCRQEVRLNQRLAPQLYLDVLPITGSLENPTLGGENAPFEFAIKMVQFDQEGLFDKLQEQEAITQAHITTLADSIADFHQKINSVDADSILGTPDSVFEPMQQNFDQVRPMLASKEDEKQLENLEAWAQSTFERLKPLLQKRRDEGKIKECHGDIHLGNITLYKEDVVLFDCIEFNEEFRWIDTISDLAFLMMDLEHRGMKAFANRLLNRYLEQSGDYEGLPLLKFYKSYRAMVRAKVSLFMRAGAEDEEAKAALYKQYQSYADLAESYSFMRNRYLLIGHGVSGSGKTTVGNALVESLGVIQIRSDVERKRLFDLDQLANSSSEVDGGIYSPAASQKTYDRLESLSKQILQAGYPIFIDATNLKRSQRDLFHEVAESEGVASILISCTADKETLKSWIMSRAEQANDASEATIEVMERQLENQDLLSEDEQAHGIVIHNNDKAELAQVIQTIKERLGL